MFEPRWTPKVLHHNHKHQTRNHQTPAQLLQYGLFITIWSIYYNMVCLLQYGLFLAHYGLFDVLQHIASSRAIPALFESYSASNSKSDSVVIQGSLRVMLIGLTYSPTNIILIDSPTVTLPHSPFPPFPGCLGCLVRVEFDRSRGANTVLIGLGLHRIRTTSTIRIEDHYLLSLRPSGRRSVRSCGVR